VTFIADVLNRSPKLSVYESGHLLFRESINLVSCIKQASVMVIILVRENTYSLNLHGQISNTL